MNSKKIELTVGIFVLAGILAITYLAVKVGGAGFSAKEHTIHARFSNIGGLKEGSNVMAAGVKIGKIGKIQLDADNLVAIVEIKLNPKQNFYGETKELIIYDDARASIRTNGLIGDKYIALDPGSSMMELPEDEIIVDTESALDIESLISKFAFGDIE